jgi:tryptophan-rich sensory protein
MNPALLFGLGGFVFFPIAKTSIAETREYYNRDLKSTSGLPSIVFPIVWNILYSLIVVSGYFTFLNSNQYDIYLIVLFFVNIMLNKYWSVFFFDFKNTKAAFFIVFLLLGTSIPYLVLVGILQNWLSFGTYLPYVVWLCVALYLNYNLLKTPTQPPVLTVPIKRTIKRQIVL